MLRTDLPDHRRSTQAELLAALRDRDPLALAEAYHRTVPAVHAVARRLFSASADVEALLRAVYAELWRDPPDEPMEAWARRRTFELGADELRERAAPPSSPSLATLLSDLPAPDVRFLDAAERGLGELDDGDRIALLAAHDRGLAAAEQGGDAPERLRRALLTLAGSDARGDEQALADPCADVTALADWVLGLVPPETAATLERLAADRPGCAAVTRALRRGRRRVEGLPATPDMGQRVLVSVLAASDGGVRAPAAVATGSAERLDSALDAPADALDAPADAVGSTGQTTPAPAGDRSPWAPAAADTSASDDEGAALVPPAERHGPDEVVEERDEDQTDSATADEDEQVVWDYDALDDDEPSAGRRALRVIGFLLLIAAGSVVGLYLGTLLVN